MNTITYAEMVAMREEWIKNYDSSSETEFSKLMKYENIPPGRSAGELKLRTNYELSTENRNGIIDQFSSVDNIKSVGYSLGLPVDNGPGSQPKKLQITLWFNKEDGEDGLYVPLTPVKGNSYRRRYEEVTGGRFNSFSMNQFMNLLSDNIDTLSEAEFTKENVQAAIDGVKGLITAHEAYLLTKKWEDHESNMPSDSVEKSMKSFFAYPPTSPVVTGFNYKDETGGVAEKQDFSNFKKYLFDKLKYNRVLFHLGLDIENGSQNPEAPAFNITTEFDLSPDEASSRGRSSLGDNMLLEYTDPCNPPC